MDTLSRLKEIRAPFFEFKRNLINGTFSDMVDAEMAIIEMGLICSFNTLLNYVDPLYLDPREEDRARIALKQLDHQP